MYQLIVTLDNAKSEYGFTFKEENLARAAIENIRNRLRSEEKFTTIKSDYGHEADLETKRIIGFHYTDLKKEIESNAERALIQALTQKRAQDKVHGDMRFKLAGPGITVENIN